jgi:hypothetical protein
MLSRDDLSAAVFIGGMEGILAEQQLFTEFHPSGKILTLCSPGGAARELALQLGTPTEQEIESVDFADMFWRKLEISPNEPRQLSTESDRK